MTKIIFDDYPEFKPNLTPAEIFKLGVFGGSYFRIIKSPHSKITYKERYKKYKFLKKLDKKLYAQETYDKDVNYYKVSVGTSYEFWNSKNWIREEYDPYGWIEWYINFFYGRRCDDDKRQIKRWCNIAGKNGRFRKQLQNKITLMSSNKADIYTGIRQTLLHWAFDTRKMKF